MTKDNKKTTSSTSSGTPVGASKSVTTNVDKLFADWVASGGSSTGSSAYKFTEQEGDAAVQSVFQQLLGRNAQGAQYAKALSLAMNQDPYTSASGRMQAVQDYVMSQPEYIARTQDKWLDAIYNDIQKRIAEARQ